MVWKSRKNQQSDDHWSKHGIVMQTVPNYVTTNHSKGAQDVTEIALLGCLNLNLKVMLIVIFDKKLLLINIYLLFQISPLNWCWWHIYATKIGCLPFCIQHRANRRTIIRISDPSNYHRALFRSWLVTAEDNKSKVNWTHMAWESILVYKWWSN